MNSIDYLFFHILKLHVSPEFEIIWFILKYGKTRTRRGFDIVKLNIENKIKNLNIAEFILTNKK